MVSSLSIHVQTLMYTHSEQWYFSVGVCANVILYDLLLFLLYKEK